MNAITLIIILLIKNLLILIILLETNETNHEALKFEVNDRVRTFKYKYIFNKGYTENRSREIFIIDSVLKNNPCTYKLKDLKGEKVIGSFYEKELLLSML